MKKHRLSIIMCVLGLFSSCSHEDLPTYDDVNRVYFAWASGTSAKAIPDRRQVNLGYDTPLKADSTVFIEIKILGKTSSKDRPVAITAIENESSAIEGEDYVILSAVIPADSTTGQVRVKLFNSDKLKTQNVSVRLQLQPNEYFHVDYVQNGENNNSKSAIEYTLAFDAKIEMPTLWADEGGATILKRYFGDYSNTKFEVICEVLGMTRAYFDYDPSGDKSGSAIANERFPSAATPGWVVLINNYLDDYKKAHDGQPLLDENNIEVKMPYSWL